MTDVKVLSGDNRQTLKTLPDQSVQCIVTSPPYFGLRDYGTAAWEGGLAECDHRESDKRNSRVAGLFHGGDDTAQTHPYKNTCRKCGAIRVDSQIGLEETPELYVAELVAVFRECKRVLKDDGTMWLNLGDSYNGSGGAGGDYSIGGLKEGQPKYPGRKISGLKPKDLIGIPWMVAFALRADGWYLRSDIIWAKPNPMPESVTDRPTKSHEYIFLLSKSAQYFYDSIAIQEPANYDGRKDEQFKGAIKSYDGVMPNGQPQSFAQNGHPRWQKDEDGNRVRNKRDVWTVTTKPYKEAHFATFPPDLIEPCILAGTSERGECPNCGKAWVRVVERGERIPAGHGVNNVADEMHSKDPMRNNGTRHGSTSALTTGEKWENKTIGWTAQCDCNAEPVPQIVLDPFGGSGTTAAVAIKHHRSAIVCELNPLYVELIYNRINKVQPMLFSG